MERMDMFHVVPGKKGRDTMGFTDKNVVVPEWGALCQGVQKE